MSAERQLHEAGRLGDRPARFVHVGLRLEQPDPLAVEHALGEPALEARAPGPEAVARGDPLDRHEADIVPLPGVAVPRIAQPDEQLHRAGAPRRRQLAGVSAVPPSASVTTVGGTIEQIGEVAVGDRRPHALGQGDVADVDRIADLAAGEVDHDLARDRVGRADQLDRRGGRC